MAGEVNLEIGGRVATVTLNQPEKLNAISLEMYRQFGDIFTELSEDETIGAIVLQGAGEKAFCAGADIGDFDDARSGSEQAKAYAELDNAVMSKLRFCPHPTIAKIRGVCVGGGLYLASMCDIRICATDTRFGFPVNRIGLTADYEELEVLCELVGLRPMLEILLEGRIFGAEEAVAKNIASRAVVPADLDAEIASCVERIVRGAPLVNRWHKKFIRRMAEGHSLTAEERDEGFACFDTEDYREGIRAFSAKQRPNFVGR